MNMNRIKTVIAAYASISTRTPLDSALHEWAGGLVEFLQAKGVELIETVEPYSEESTYATWLSDSEVIEAWPGDGLLVDGYSMTADEGLSLAARLVSAAVYSQRAEPNEDQP